MTSGSSKFSIIYYTDNHLPPVLQRNFCLNLIPLLDYDFISVSQKPMPGFGRNVCIGDKLRCELTMWEQIRVGLDHAKHDLIFLCEHDVLYSKDHFSTWWYDQLQDPGESAYYDVNLYRANNKGFFQECKPILSMMAIEKQVLKPLIYNCMLRQESVRLENHLVCSAWRAENPSIDIRHQFNLTGRRTRSQYLDEIPFWGRHDKLWKILIG